MKDLIKKKVTKWLLSNIDYLDKHLVLTEAVKDLFNTISADDILTEKGSTWLFKGKEIPGPVVQVLTDQASAFKQSKLWEILKTDIQYQSNKKTFLTSQTEVDLIAGKLYLYVLDSIESRLSGMSSRKAKLNL